MLNYVIIINFFFSIFVLKYAVHCPFQYIKKYQNRFFCRFGDSFYHGRGQAKWQRNLGIGKYFLFTITYWLQLRFFENLANQAAMDRIKSKY